MQLVNVKLQDRGAKMVASELKIDYEQAVQLLQVHGSVRKAIDSVSNPSSSSPSEQ